MVAELVLQILLGKSRVCKGVSYRDVSVIKRLYRAFDLRLKRQTAKGAPTVPERGREAAVAGSNLYIVLKKFRVLLDHINEIQIQILMYPYIRNVKLCFHFKCSLFIIYCGILL